MDVLVYALIILICWVVYTLKNDTDWW